MNIASSLLVLTTITLLAGIATAQCTAQWTSGDPYPTPRGTIYGSTFWDPDGAGPLPSQLVVCGDLLVSNTIVGGVLTYDGTAWRAIGAAPTTFAITVWNGQLVALSIAGSQSRRALQWTGTTWLPIGTFGSTTGAPSTDCFAVYNGDLVVGGFFTSVNGIPAASIARFDGTTWSALGSGIGGAVLAMAVFNNQLRVGGVFNTAGGAPAGNQANWNGTAWSIGPSFNSAVRSMAVRNTASLATTYLFVGGDFTQYSIAGQNTPAAHIARLEGFNNTWSAVGTGVPGTSCRSLFVRNIGLTSYELAAGTEDTSSSARFWRYSGGVWASLGSFEPASTGPRPTTINYYGGRYTVGLGFNTADAMRSWDGSVWQPLRGEGIAGAVYAIEASGNDTVIGGDFATISGVTMNGIARGQAGNWTPLGTGMSGGLGVFALETAANGDLVAGGDFTTAGGVACNRIARWNGTSWTSLGAGVDGTVVALLTLPGGDVIAAGDFTSAGGVPCSRVARWNGSAWSPLGAGFPARVNALALLPDGSIVAGGNFLTSGTTTVNRIARWNGASWQPLGGGCNDVVFALAVRPNGELCAGGRFTSVDGISCRVGRWNGTAWSAVFTLGISTADDVVALGAHPNGDLFIGGSTFTFTTPLGGFTSNLLRLSGNLGTQAPMGVLGTLVYDIAFPAGDVAIGGLFTSAGGIAVNVGRYDTTCPATATPFGTGCAGLTAPLALQVLDAPWLGSSWRLRAATFGPGSFGVQALGLGQLALPLAAVLGGALPGCTGYVTPDDLTVAFPTAGAITFGGAVPNVPALAGFTMHAQVLQFEAAGTGLAISASNGVQLVLGLL